MTWVGGEITPEPPLVDSPVCSLLPKLVPLLMNFHDMSLNITMLNETFLVIKKYHEISPIIIICHQMSSNDIICHHVKWNNVTFSDTWWCLRIFKYFSWQNQRPWISKVFDKTMCFIMTFHDIWSIMMTSHHLFGRGRLFPTLLPAPWLFCPPFSRFPKSHVGARYQLSAGLDNRIELQKFLILLIFNTALMQKFLVSTKIRLNLAFCPLTKLV